MLAGVDASSILQAITTRHRGTCEWVSNEAQFSEWEVSNNSGLLWLYGAPGFGKTVMSKYIIERCEHQETSLVAYFHCDGKDESRKTELNTLRSIIFQLLVRNSRFFEHVLKYMEIERLGIVTSFSTTVSTLWKILEDICATSVREIRIVIDAVDELGTADIPRVLQGLTDLVVRSTGAQSALKVAVVSRPELEIQRQLSLPFVRKIELSSTRSQKDIETYLSETVGKFAAENDFPDDQRDAVIEALRTRSDGMFLWVTLAWTSFVGGDDDWCKASIKAWINELEHLPRGIDALYRTILKKIPKSKQPKTRLLLTWLVYAFRPLKVQELGVVLALRPFHSSHYDLEENLGFNPEKRLRSLCGNLINIRNGNVSLLHQSTREFLVSSLGHPEDRFGDGGDFVLGVHAASLELSISCLTYLNFDGFDIRSTPSLSGAYFTSKDIDADIAKVPFVKYCAEYWPRHVALVSEAEAEGVSKLVQRLAENEYKLAFEYQLRRSLLGKSPGKPPPSLHIIVEYGLLNVLLVLGSKVENMNQINSYNETALHMAVNSGSHSHKILRYLLQHQRVDVNAKTKFGETALHYAMRISKESEIEPFLAERRVDLNIRNRDGMALVHLAINNDWDLLNRLILNPKVDLNCEDLRGIPPLLIAAYWGKESATRGIIKSRRARLRVKDPEGRTPLQHCIKQDWRDLTKMCLDDEEVGANEIDRDGNTILHLLTSMGWADVVKYLLERKSVNVNARNKDDQTALHLAAKHREAGIARLLISHQAILDVKDKDGRTALQRAAEFGSKPVLMELVENGSDLALVDKEKRTVLHWAASWSWADVVEMLLQRMESGVRAKNSYGETALHIAAQCGNRNIVRLLMSRGFDLADKDNQGNNALHWAAKGQNPEIVLDLLKSNPNLVNDRCIAWQSPLHLATTWGNLRVVKVLLWSGAQVQATDDFGMTPLHCAAKQGDTRIAGTILQDERVDVNAEDHLGRTPLYIACEWYNKEVVDMLLRTPGISKRGLKDWHLNPPAPPSPGVIDHLGLGQELIIYTSYDSPPPRLPTPTPR